jgi:uncharacterized protein YndB with AHSA1/START domain
MSTDSIEVSGVIPASPEVLYEAWLDPEKHAAMSGAPATVDGDLFTAWGGYISGRIVSAQPPAVIEQRWRTLDFPEDAPDSLLRVRFEAVPGGTRVSFEQSEIPAGQGENYEGGWVTHYLEPMGAHFGG